MLIACEDKKMELEQGMTVEQCLIKLGVSREGVLAVQQGGRVLEMNAPVTQPGLLHLLTMHTEEGRRIYERSVRFLLLAATNRVLPGQRVRIEYSVSGGVLLRMPGHAITEEETRAIARQMHALAAQNLPLRRKNGRSTTPLPTSTRRGRRIKSRCSPAEQRRSSICTGWTVCGNISTAQWRRARA